MCNRRAKAGAVAGLQTDAAVLMPPGRATPRARRTFGPVTPAKATESRVSWPRLLKRAAHFDYVLRSGVVTI
jgi:hypothetical protein